MEEHESISVGLIDDICTRLAQDKRIRQTLPGGVTLRIDRLLPFICIYRRDPARNDTGTERLVMSEASCLVAPGTADVRPGLQQLVQGIAKVASQKLGSFLIMEVWSQIDSDVLQVVDETTGERVLPRAGFRILVRQPHRPDGAVATLAYSLQELRLHRKKPEVEIEIRAANHAPGLSNLLSEREANRFGSHVVGLEVRPVFRDPKTGEVYESILRSLTSQISHALKKAFYAYTLNRTSFRPEHHLSLGSRRIPGQVLAVDRQLAEVSRQFGFLLLVTPINAERAWHEFEQSGYRKKSVFQYRPLGGDPMLLKRRLMKIRTEKIDDPTFAHLMRETQTELDRQLSMLDDIATPNFLPGSLQVYGRVDKNLYDLAREILVRLPPRVDDEPVDPNLTFGATEFLDLANEELRYYQQQSSTFNSQAQIRDDIYSGMLASGGNLLIGRETQIFKRRANALLQHEVGVHLVTYHNGASQPLRLMQVGLAGYDALQEGFAVLSEYLVNGLSRGRLRTLAARVIASAGLIREESFQNVFEQLVDEFGFEPRNAYTITMRVFRGGGLTKDAIYLRGLAEVLDYFGNGGDVEPLLVGKIATSHIPVVRELMLRGILKPPALTPRFLTDDYALKRLKSIKSDTTVLDLIDDHRPTD